MEKAELASPKHPFKRNDQPFFTYPSIKTPIPKTQKYLELTPKKDNQGNWNPCKFYYY
jgi:hypothetical protein